jgi:hypothetical protein
MAIVTTLLLPIFVPGGAFEVSLHNQTGRKSLNDYEIETSIFLYKYTLLTQHVGVVISVVLS